MSGAVRKDYVRPIDFKHGCVDMTHGSGGRAMAQLIEELFLRAFDNDYLRQGTTGSGGTHGAGGRCACRLPAVLSRR